MHVMIAGQMKGEIAKNLTGGGVIRVEESIQKENAPHRAAPAID